MHEQFFRHFDNIHSQSSLALGLSKDNIRRSVHSAQIYDALKNLYLLAGPDPFDENTGRFNAPTLRKLSQLNNIDLRSVKNPEFYSNLQLFLPNDTAEPPNPDDAVAAELANISAATSGGPHWVSQRRPSRTMAPKDNTRSPSESGDDSDNDPDYAPSSGVVQPGVASDDEDSNVDNSEVWEGYDMDDDDAEFGPVGIPHYATNQAEFTSSGSLGSTSGSEEGSED